MKLVKQPDNLTFTWKDVTFSIRGKATAADKFELDMTYDVDIKGQVKVDRRLIYLTLIRQFVSSWSGVTDDEGQAVPFSMDNLMNLPPDPQEDVIVLLGGFIWQNTGIHPTPDQKKSPT